MRIHIIYPDDRYVDEDVIRGWYRDAVADGDIEEADHEVDLWEAIRLLEDVGHITTDGKTKEELI